MSSNALLWPSQGTKPEERLDKYKYLRLPSQGVGGLVQIEGDPLLALFPAIADATFQFYKFYQITPGQAPGNETNTPLVIIDTLGAGIIQEASGFDIRVFDSAGMPIPYEVISVTPSTGDFIVWLNMPQAQDFEFVQLTFGKPTATDGSTPNSVYDSNYTSVYHLDGVGTDSTSNAQDMTLNGVTTVAAKIGNGLNFTGTVDDFTIRNPYTPFPASVITCEYWAKTTGTGDGMVSYAVPSQTNHFLTFCQNAFVVLIVDVTTGTTGISFNDDIFHHIVVTWRSSDGQLFIYIDGVEEFDLIHQQGASHTDGGALVLGQDQDTVGGGFQAAQAYNGILEEFRLSDNFRSADYVTASFNNQNDNNAFWFRTPILENGIDNLLVDDMGRVIVAVGQP